MLCYCLVYCTKIFKTIPNKYLYTEPRILIIFFNKTFKFNISKEKDNKVSSKHGKGWFSLENYITCQIFCVRGRSG